MKTYNPVGWFEIYVSDLDRAKKFYSTVFQYELTDAPPMEGNESMLMSFFPMIDGQPNSSGALVKMEGVEPGPGGTLIYFSCEDCSVEEERAAAAGGTVFQAKMPIGEYGFISIVSDSEGNMIGLHSNL